MVHNKARPPDAVVKGGTMRNMPAGALLAALLVLAPGATPWVRAAHAQTPSERGAYVNIGLAVQAPQDARFADGADDGHAPLYGRPELFTSGEFGTAFLSHIAAGYRFMPRLRFQVEIGMARQREYRGTANYAGAGAFQPSSADLGTRQLLAAGFYDVAVWRIGPVLRIEPYVGAGAGFTYYRLDNFVQRFPDPDDAAGYLRRGAADEVPFTDLPAGSGRSATGMVTAGLAVPVGGRVRFDLAYRYTDAGSVGTAAGGDILIVRYNRGYRSEVEVPINETAADFRTHAMLATLRVDF